MTGTLSLSERLGILAAALALSASLAAHPALAQGGANDPAAAQDGADSADEDMLDDPMADDEMMDDTTTDDAAADDAADDAGGAAPAAVTTAADGSCAPGALGQGGEFRVRGETGARFVRAEIGFQCERTLDDGTYVPGGYRVQLYETCDAGECKAPFVFATEGRKGMYTAVLDNNGERTQMRLRANRNGVIVLTSVGGGRGEARERERYTLREAR